MSFKLSKYNVSYKGNDEEYIWNTYSGALLKLDKEGRKYFNSFSGIDDGSNEFSTLSSNGFIVNKNIDEFGRICFEEKQAMFTHKSDSFSVVIAPGLGCNYKCTYCFQSEHDKACRMSLNIAKDVVEYIILQLKSNSNIKKVNIRWFGGEPLLYLDIIEFISHIIMEYANNNNLIFSAGIITNGRLLTADTVAKLQMFHVSKAQITVDGMCDLYCNSKGASEEDFNQTIENICNVAEKIKISIRLNIPQNNAQDAIAVTNYLLVEKKLKGKIGIYFAFVREYSLSAEEEKKAYINYVKNYYIWLDYVADHFGADEINGLYPKRKITSCGYIRICNACIGAEGELYKCEHCFGDSSMKAGDIWQGWFYNGIQSLYCSTIDIRTTGKCKDCKYLPICMGGCANDFVLHLVGQDCETFQRLQLKLKLMEGGVRI